MGQTEEEALPTVVVMVGPGIVFDWASLEQSIKRLIGADLPSYVSIPEIEFLPGSLSLSTIPDRVGEVFPGVSYVHRETRKGHPSSIGVRGGRGGGTMGCNVTLSQNGITRKGILTSYHVVRPPSSASREMTESRLC